MKGVIAVRTINTVVETFDGLLPVRVLTDEGLNTASLETLGDLLEEVMAEIAKLNRESEQRIRAIGNGRMPTDGSGKVQLKEKLAALHQYRQKIIDCWKIADKCQKRAS